MKKLACMLLALLMVFILAGCGGDASPSEAPQDTSSGESSPVSEKESEAPTETTAPDDVGNGGENASDFTIGLVTKHTDDFMKALEQGAKDAAAEIGLNIKPLMPSSTNDIEGQIQMIESLVSEGVDALLLAPQNPDTVINALQAAADKGVKIVMVDTDSPDFTDKVSFVSISNEEAAYQGAVAFSGVLPEGGNVLVLGGISGDTNAEARNDGFERGFAETGVNILEIQDAQWTAEKGASVMEDMITKYGDEIDGVIVSADDMGIGAIQSIIQAGREEQIKVCGFGGFATAKPFIEDGNMDMTIGMQPYMTGYLGVETAWEALQGNAVDEFVDTGVLMVTKDNMDEFTWF
ncbi:MAG: sugar ABC transporter substrate-binding protein [Christensenellales bacterium]|jgi:ribose transport system substrate-binding protein